ncbi:amidohydrolase family protein, partial [Vibrio vulnificus]
SEEAIAETERFIQALELLGQDEPLAPLPVITPRFVPSCTDETLAGLGKLAQKYDLPIQSHVSESNWEHQYAIDRFGIHDAEVLDCFGLLT